MGGLPDDHIFWCRGSITVCLVSGIYRLYERARDKSQNVYLSLGNKEEKSRNPVIAKVGDCIREGYAWLKAEGLNCTLEWNQGGHFKEPMTRTARAFAWAMQQSKNESRVEKEHL